RAFLSEVSIVRQNHFTSSREATHPATVLFAYLAANMIIWLFLRTIEVESLFARTTIPLAITAGVIVPLHAWWIHTRQR
ncbi:MAG: hypothetical protein OSB47_07390, partial [Pirellulaceae bacterium]|nr:hypothetical protein [Pirellulaceae bacterium]